MDLLSAFQVSFLVALAYETLIYFIALLKKNNGLADVAWGPGFVVIALAHIYLVGEMGPVQQFVFIFLSLWAFRLAVHIYSRGRGKKEDFRYANWRKEWGENFLWRSYLQVYVLQGLMMALIAAPVVAIMQLGADVQFEPNLFAVFGVLTFIVGFLFETVADAQLRDFKKNKKSKGKIFREGLWSYTRHPNYFGEFLVWWGFYFIAFSFGAWETVFAPALISFLLLKVSGVVMLEKKYKKNKSYQKYVKEVPAFLPFKSDATYFVVGVLMVLLAWSAVSYQFSDVERLEYEVLMKEGDFELRLVDSHIIAETQVFADNYEQATGIGFQRVAGYIFGANISNEEVEMTTPVVSEEGQKIAMTVPVVTGQSEKIAMTAPVVSEGEGENSYNISFVMPEKYTMESLPKPKSKMVFLREVPEKKMAVIKFSWFANSARRQMMEQKLMSWVKSKRLRVKDGQMQLAQYNDPWSPPFMRLNEVWIEVE